MDDITNLKPEDLEKLTTFVAACRAKPELLQLPQFAFFRDYLAHMGANLADGGRGHRAPLPPKSKTAPEPKPEDPPEEEEIESEVELNNEGVIEPETQDPPELGDADKEVSEEDMDAANEKRSEAMSAMSDGDFQKSVDLFTEAIKLNPGSAMFYAKRACVLLKQERVNAAIRDCDEALKLNPDSAVAFKFRGRANRLLGNWLEAAKDLRLACKLDFDEQSDEWLKEVIPNATKLEEHNRKYERLRKEKDIREKKERIRLAQEAAKKAQEEQKKQGFSASGGVPGGFPGFPGGFPGGMPGGFPGGMPGGFPGGMPGGMSAGMFGEDGPPTGRAKPGPSAGPFGDAGGSPGGDFPDFSEIFKDPEIMTAMQDPEVAAAFQDVSSNPGNIFKYQSNPKIAGVINKVLTKMGGPAPPGGERPDTEGSNDNSTPYNDDLD